MKLSILLALLISLTLPQGPKPQKSLLKTSYDKLTDRTTVSFGPKSIKGKALSITTYFSYPGRVPSEPIKHIGLVFDSYSSRDWRYLREQDRVLFILADTERITASPSSIDPIIDLAAIKERLIFTVTVEQLARLAQASKVEVRLGRDEFGLDNETLAALRELQSKIE
jgi:hypothetical protein